MWEAEIAKDTKNVQVAFGVMKDVPNQQTDTTSLLSVI